MDRGGGRPPMIRVSGLPVCLRCRSAAAASDSIHTIQRASMEGVLGALFSLARRCQSPSGYQDLRHQIPISAASSRCRGWERNGGDTALHAAVRTHLLHCPSQTFRLRAASGFRAKSENRHAVNEPSSRLRRHSSTVQQTGRSTGHD